ncbi:unnamed protein product, partial [Nesidiocoris tenuis]
MIDFVLATPWNPLEVCWITICNLQTHSNFTEPISPNNFKIFKFIQNLLLGQK